MQNRIISKIFVMATCCAAFVLSGCVSTSLRSMASTPTPLVHQPRLDPTSEKSEVAVSADAFGIVNGSWLNTNDIYGGGGAVSGTYRAGGSISPLFATAHVAGFGGKVNFECMGKNGCKSGFEKWLRTDDGKDDYNFWAIQEQVMVGAEFDTRFFMNFGLAAGARMFQGGGSYDDKRDELEDEIAVRNKDDGFGVSPAVSLWLGFRIGDKAQNGSIIAQVDYAREYIVDDNDEGVLPVTLSYFHPSGFHGGVTFVKNMYYNLYFGKTFTF
ncbi:MAG: hypothetical protein MJY99_02460 [Fibrobacter sp.]|uniref:hypothetical protein n=1 Tax=Fibrobacter sp. TaxID=35828 RepID=UPI00388DB222|nr:hypothetical protein [Fibrobacter sp.]